MNKKWSFDLLQIEANKYQTRSEFRKKSKGAYIESSRKGLINDLFKNHHNEGFSKKRKKNGYWTKENLQIEANKYQTRSEFWCKNSSAAKAALKKNITDELFKNHNNEGFSEKKKKDGYWDKDRLQAEANKYKTRNDLRFYNPSAYSSAHKKNIIDELFIHHYNNGFSDYKWQKNSYVIYAYELINFNKVYIGLTNNIERRNNEHIFNEKEPLNIFCMNNNISYPCYTILEDNLESDDAKRQELYWINYYKLKKWQLFNQVKGGSLGRKSFKWNKNLLQKEVNKYKTRGEFNKNNPSAYNAARKKKLIDELFKKHSNQGFSIKSHGFGYWNLNKIKEAVDKYQTIKEFRKGQSGAYAAAKRLGIFESLFKDHPNQGKSEKQKISGYWNNKEKLQEEANKYQTISEFKRKSGSAYNAANRLQILNQLFDNPHN